MLVQLLSARDLDRWRVFLSEEPVGWPALNLHQAAVRLPHYAKRTRLKDLLFAAPAARNPAPKRADPESPTLDQADHEDSRPVSDYITPERAIAWTEMALQMGVPDLKRKATN